MQFQISSRRENHKEIPDSSRLEFLEKFLANNFALSDVEGSTSRPFNRKSIADLPLLRTLLAIHQNSREQSFREGMDSFVLLAYASLAASRALLQQLQVCLNFTLNSEDLFCWYKWKKWFLWIMVAAQAAENHGDEWGLTWYLWWGIYTCVSGEKSPSKEMKKKFPNFQICYNQFSYLKTQPMGAWKLQCAHFCKTGFRYFCSLFTGT